MKITEKKQYSLPSTTLVHIQLSSICNISSITGGDLDLGGAVDSGTLDPL